ncbi:subclass B3 metallo-beta-lactamase [Aggregicoccus sp. 17bor-14]|uniref:subclass B3 metallo-beta-lactamase n=1 Tax=Myxococcaceae TaxID=31 RepID=UPI00129C3CAB|nr:MULTISPECIES: subclass B3 metallo-beta-lactamase [Myxococcaceae]MBF5044289.1 subclass B3 metallo-beta-lactamase [Simulacricoccus sp. 17bor-14]MRI90038.1 subclass B3 metallo-beta-lactamase [Aggregicoccus sp. 17bor-14]
MRLLALLLLLPCAAAASPPASLPPSSDTKPIRCDACAAWNAPQAPFRVYGNTYYVGVAGLSSVLIDTGRGLILLDGALPQSAPRIARSLRTLGFSLRDVKWLLNSHAHSDHAGGLAALQRLSGARVAASPAGAAALRAGAVAPDDPQVGFVAFRHFPAVREVTPVADGQSVRLGDVVVTAHHTPGHTPGGVTWTWRSCEGERCADVVYAESLSAVAAPHFRFSADAARVAQLRRSIATVRELPCDVMIPTHPAASRLFAQWKASASGGRAAFLDAGACRAYAERAEQGLSERLAKEAEGKAP